MISCILLTAGSSSRFGSPKALARLNQETVIEDIQASLMNSPISEVIIVLGDQKELIEPYLLNHKKIKIVYNNDYYFGQTSSFKKGLEAASMEAQGFMLFPVDYPHVKEKTVCDLCDFFIKFKPLIVVPSFQGQKGHPPLFSSSLKKEFLSLKNDQGINAVSHVHKDQVELFSVEDSGVIKTFNTREEFENLKNNV